MEIKPEVLALAAILETLPDFTQDSTNDKENPHVKEKDRKTQADRADRAYAYV